MAIKQAQNAAKTALQQYLYTDVCNVIQYQDVKNPITRLTSKQEVTVLENQPCRLSFETVHSAAESDTATAISQNVKLFLAPEIEILPGSKIIVTHEGRAVAYSQSGIPAVYPTHQEIMLTIAEERA